MAVFSSERERRLWLYVLAVVIAIYSTLGIASTLSGVLLHRGIYDQVFVVGFFVLGVSVMTHGLRIQPRGVQWGIGLGIAAVYLMVLARLGIPERTHLFEYSVVAVLVYEALLERVHQGRRIRFAAFWAVGVTAFVGVVDECIQLFLPSRVFDPVDIGFNFLAAVMAVLACVVLRWTRERFV